MRSIPKRWPCLRWLFLLAAAGTVCVAVALGSDPSPSFATFASHRQDLVAWQEAHPILAAAAFVGLYAVVSALSLPVAPALTVIGGFLFGVAWGTACTVAGATLGATALFLLVRRGFGERWRARAGPAIRRFEDGFRRHTISYLLFLRLVPLVPFWLVNLLPAFLGVPFRAFVVTTALGIVPGTIVYAALGHSLGDVLEQGDTPDLGVVLQPGVFVPLLGLAVLSLLPVLIARLSRVR